MQNRMWKEEAQPAAGSKGPSKPSKQYKSERTSKPEIYKALLGQDLGTKQGEEAWLDPKAHQNYPNNRNQKGEQSQKSLKLYSTVVQELGTKQGVILMMRVGTKPLIYAT